MFSFEKKLLDKIEKHLPIWITLLAFLLGLYLRYALGSFCSEDMYNYLKVWYDDIKSSGGLAALSHQVGNYNILYQFIIALFTYLPIHYALAYKGLSIVFDFLLAVFTGWYLYDREGEKDLMKASLGFSLIWLSPIVALNSSMWGQCDAIYTFFAVMALCSLEKERYTRSFVFLGIAFAFKLQTVFLLPYFIYRYLKDQKFSLFNFFWIPGIMMVSSLPGIIAGRGLFCAFTVYFGQTEDYGCLSMNSPSLISLIAYDYQQTHYDYLAPLFICLALIVVALMIFVVLGRKIALTASGEWLFALLLTYSCVFFLPAMHERYGFLYEILAILYCFKNKKGILPALSLTLISLCTYGHYLMSGSVPYTLCAVLNCLTYAAYVYLFLLECRAGKEGSEND